MEAKIASIDIGYGKFCDSPTQSKGNLDFRQVKWRTGIEQSSGMSVSQIKSQRWTVTKVIILFNLKRGFIEGMDSI